MNDYGELQTAVQSFFIRSDFPDTVYSLATAELNRRLRLREMESTSTLSVSSESASLPSDYLMMRHVYIDSDPRFELDAVSEFAKNASYRSSGRPATYTIAGDTILFNPVPDGTYSVDIRYIAKLDDFSSDSDTNDVLATFPEIYLYACLKHAAVWAQDTELATGYGGLLDTAIERAHQANQAARYGGPLSSVAVSTA